MKKISSKMLLNVLKKDVVILKKQKKISQEYIQQGCGQFLNVENPRWNGGYLSVINLYDDMIKFANQTIKLLNLLYKEPENPFEFVVETFKKITNSNENNVFLLGNDENDGILRSKNGKTYQIHHSVFPNLLKLKTGIDLINKK